jgi:TonB family protein
VRVTGITLIVFALLFFSMAEQRREAKEEPRFEPPKVISAEQANYPPDSIAAGGAVILEAEIDETGALRDIHVVRDVPSLTEPAKSALRKWKFAPAQLDGKPVAARLPVVFSFNIPYWCGPAPRKRQ